MPTTYAQIASTTVASTTNTVTFNGIDGTYTDLVLVMDATATTNFTNTKIIINSDTGTNYSWVNLKADGSSVTSSRSSANTADLYLGLINQGRGTYRFVFNNYANTSMYKHIIASGGLAGNRVEYGIGQWRNTNAITSIQIVQPADTFTVGSTFTLYGIRSASYGAKATGGVITSDANYYYHTFFASGTFTPSQNLTCDYLVVAGGAGGGGYYYGAGGGAGGLRSTVTATGGGGSLESALSLTASTNYTVTVGAGGAGGAFDNRGTNGSNSVFSSITSNGGGGGGNGNNELAGASGGSGGGGGASNISSTRLPGSGTNNQGYGGGNASTSYSGGASGGGGGAGAVGGDASGTTGGNGGNGVTVAISGSSVTYAGGGGGSTYSGTQGSGGTGGGGQGARNQATTVQATSGTTNTGSGGGGANQTNTTTAGAGGSGIVIVRYSR